MKKRMSLGKKSEKNGTKLKANKNAKSEKKKRNKIGKINFSIIKTLRK